METVKSRRQYGDKSGVLAYGFIALQFGLPINLAANGISWCLSMLAKHLLEAAAPNWLAAFAAPAIVTPFVNWMWVLKHRQQLRLPMRPTQEDFTSGIADSMQINVLYGGTNHALYEILRVYYGVLTSGLFAKLACLLITYRSQVRRLRTQTGKKESDDSSTAGLEWATVRALLQNVLFFYMYETLLQLLR